MHARLLWFDLLTRFATYLEQPNMSQKTLLVTGASRGIGAEIALQAAQSGYQVAINYLNSEAAANALVDRIRVSGGTAMAIRADVGDSDQVIRMFQTLDQAYGSLDVLINNAGILESFSITEADSQHVEKTFRANVLSVFYCCREAVKRMSTASGGHGGAIVNMSSVAARHGGVTGGTAYSASKGALDAFGTALAKEVGPLGIRVNTLRPGLIETEIHNVRGGIAAITEMAKITVPMGRTGSAAEVAQAALWLASDAASYVHASVLDVAGGR